MKKILFDLLCAQPSIDSKFHGGGEYTKTIFEYLVNHYHGTKAEIFVMYNKNRFLDEWILELVEKKNIKIFFIENEEEFYKYIDLKQFDVFYAGMSFVFDVKNTPSSIKKYCTIHDLRNYEEPVDTYSYLFYDSFIGKVKQQLKLLCINYLRKRNLDRYRKRISAFDEFFCVSEHTNYMVKTMLPEFNNKKSYVLYTPSKHYIKSCAPKDFYEDNFLLMVSSNRWLKNAFRAIKALDDLYDKKMIKEKTVLVGKISNTILSKISNKEMFINCNYLSSEELEYMYEKCQILIYPSLNEGFGMPPLEAMRYGKTCVISGICSLPELYNGVAYFINPYKIEEIEGRIYNAINKKIDKDKVLKRFEDINNRQNNDLKKLCDILIEE